jgi:hypothetical protein
MRTFASTLFCWMGLTAAGAALLAGGCAELSRILNGGTDGGTGQLRVLITDKPFPFEVVAEAWVTITKVDVRRAGDAEDDADDRNDLDGSLDPDDQNDSDDSNGSLGSDDPDELHDSTSGEADSDDDGPGSFGRRGGRYGMGGRDKPRESNPADDSDDDGEDGRGGYVTIFEGEKAFNLLDLQNGRTDLLADAEIPAGTYTQMRLVVTRGKVKLTDGREFDLRVPSGESSGIKLHFTFTVETDDETRLLLDVDLSRAFSAVPSGKMSDPTRIREFRFHPSFGMRLIRLLDAGSIRGIVADEAGEPIVAAAVTAYDAAGAEVTSTSTDASGAYVLSGLAAGTYRVEFSAAGYQDRPSADVAVTAGETTDLGTTMLAIE